MPKISASVHKTLVKLDAAMAIVAPKRGTSAAILLAGQLRQALQSGKPFDVRWGDDTRRVNPDMIRIHKSTVTFQLEDQDFDLGLSAIGYIQVGEDKDGTPRYEPGFYEDDDGKGISFETVEVVVAERKARKAA